MKKVLVTGSRDFQDVDLIVQELNRIQTEIGPFILIEGGAQGADRIARNWAHEVGLPVCTVEANWKRYFKAAGHIRNGWMVALQPDFCVGFPGPRSRGTYDCMDQARDAGIPTWTPFRDPVRTGP